MEKVIPLDIAELATAFRAELEQRRFADGPGCYAEQRGSEEALYGLTGAVNIYAAFGWPLGDRAARREWAARILTHRDSQGHFISQQGPGHAMHMVLGALNLLGEPIPDDIAPLAPAHPEELARWLDRLDWTGTHKEFCGQTIPLLAGGRVTDAWVEVLLRNLSERLNPQRPMEIWCGADVPAWRVISCMYHVLMALDAGACPYPQPQLLIQRLIELQWEDAPETEYRTVCTDGDWAWMLKQLCMQLPRYFEPTLATVRKVSARRVRAWREHPEAVLTTTTHNLYCYLWSTAVFQSMVREHYQGGYLRDTLNDPALFRL